MVGANEETYQSQHSLITFIKFLFKKWWLFGIIGLAFGIFGYLYARSQEITFQSNLSFVIDQGNNTGISGAVNIASQFGISIPGGMSDIVSGDNIIEIIKSRNIIEKTFLSVDTFDEKPFTLIEFYLYQINKSGKEQNSKKEIHFPANISKASLNYQQDSVLYYTYLNFVNNSLEVDRPDKMLSIFSIRVNTPDERFTKIFTDKLSQATDSFYTDMSSKKERKTLAILEQRVASMRGSLSSSISSKASSQDANLNPVFEQSQIPLQKQQVNIQVYGAAYAEMFKNLEVARFQLLNKTPLIQIIDHAEYPMKKIKPGKLKMAILFAFSGVFITILIFWLIRLYKNLD